MVADSKVACEFVAFELVAFELVAFELIAFEFVAVLEFQLFVDLMHRALARSSIQFVPFHNSQSSNSTLEIRSKRQLNRS